MSTKRGHAACNGCRARKQKCDEKKPTCSRCRSLHRTCEWPRLCKRGPAKGYMGALEQRLAETENALFQVLSAVNDETLELAFSENNQYFQGRERDLHQIPDDVEVPGGAGSKKATSVAYWEKFPLKTARDLKNWTNMAYLVSSETRSGTEKNRDPGSRVTQDLDDSTIPSHEVEDFVQPTTYSLMEIIRNVDDMVETQHRSCSPGLTVPTRTVVAEVRHLVPGLLSEQTQASNLTEDGTGGGQEKETVSLPLEFREQFLW